MLIKEIMKIAKLDTENNRVLSGPKLGVCRYFSIDDIALQSQILLES